jgi:hypothetical protein
MDNAFKGAELVEAPRDGAPSAGDHQQHGDDRAVREPRHRDRYDAYGKRQREGQVRIGSFVSFWPWADHFRCSSTSGRSQGQSERLKGATNGLMHRSKKAEMA